MIFFGEMSMIKFLHAADLHLDSPFSALPPDKAEVRRAEFRAAFTSLTMYARMNKIDFLFLPGDLFDSDYASRDTVALKKRTGKRSSARNSSVSRSGYTSRRPST